MHSADCVTSSSSPTKWTSFSESRVSRCVLLLAIISIRPIPAELDLLEIYNLAFSIPPETNDADDAPEVSKQYYERLRDTSIATQKLLAAFAQLAPKSASLEAKELQKQCTIHLTESASLRAETRMLRSRLSQTIQELEACREQLAAMANRAERAKSKTVVALESKYETSNVDTQEPVTKTEDTPVINGGHSPAVGSTSCPADNEL